MFLSLQIQNFKSILDLLLTTKYGEGKAPNGYKECNNYIFLEENKLRTSPILSIYGANASGKSNIIEAVEVFLRIINNGIHSILYQPNKLNKKYNDTKFELNIVWNKDNYTYTIVYNKNSIVTEKLVCNNQVLICCENNRLKSIFKGSELYNKEKLSEIYNVECKNNTQQQTYTMLMKLATNYANLNLKITAFFNYLINNIEILEDKRINSTYNSLKKLTKELGNEQLALEKITNLIKKFDIDIENITYELKKSSINDYTNISWTDLANIDHQANTISYCQFYTYHKNMKNEVEKFKLQEESSGTQALISLIGISLAVLEKGGLLFVDELDLSIHPLVLVEIVRLFKDKRYNKKNAQLIFTLHCSDLLDDNLIRKSEVGIVTKTKKLGSSFVRLSDFKNIRNTLDFRKRYLYGEFSGIPHAYI